MENIEEYVCEICGCIIEADCVEIIGCSNRGCMNHPGNIF